MLPVFDPNSPCAKCGHVGASTTYCPGSLDPKHLPGCECQCEHLHRRCARCGYEWLEACLDLEAPDPEA